MKKDTEKKAIIKKSKCKVHYHDLFGVRQSKYDFLWNHDIGNVNWQKLSPNKEYYFFVPKDFSQKNVYDNFVPLKSIFKLGNMGIASGDDEKYVKFNDSDYEKNEQSFVEDYFYRPFDNRKILYDTKQLQRARYKIMKNVHESNYILCCVRQNKKNNLNSMITKNLACRDSITNHTYIFPLYILSNGEDKMYFEGVKEPELQYNTKSGYKKTENFTNEFRDFITEKYNKFYNAEQILGYIYAILHSSTYRQKYIEFLKIDFPRIPFTDDEKMFQKLSKIGWGLIQNHLLKVSYAKNICRLEGTGKNFKVEKVSFDKGNVWINNDRYFENVPQEIWEFHIGGYQVLEKWLKERKKHEITLSPEDFRHFILVVNVLDYTIKTMERIDELTNEWI